MTMRLRLLKFAARRPLLALSLATATAAAAVGGIAAAVTSRSTHCGAHAAQVDHAAETADGSPRMILGRVWFDKLPEKRTDMIEIGIPFFGGGVAFYEKGSVYRLTLDSAEFERQGEKINLTYLQDKESVNSKFTIKACEDKPPFDIRPRFRVRRRRSEALVRLRRRGRHGQQGALGKGRDEGRRGPRLDPLDHRPQSLGLGPMTNSTLPTGPRDSAWLDLRLLASGARSASPTAPVRSRSDTPSPPS